MCCLHAPKYLISVFIFFNVHKVVPPAVQCQVYLKYDRNMTKKGGFLQLYFENFSIFSFTMPVNNIFKLDLCRALKKTFDSGLVSSGELLLFFFFS